MERCAYALALAYCGQPFSGWQRQGDRPTVQAAVEAALAKVGLNVAVSAAARTDAGVHARRQLLTFRVREQLPVADLLVALNSKLPTSVRARSLRPVGPSFHARASPHLREYRYRVSWRAETARCAWNLPDPSLGLPLLPDSFDLHATRDFLHGLEGQRDRTTHTTRPLGPKVTLLILAKLDERPGGLHFTFEGDGFTRHLVRNWVWAAVARGCGVRANHESPIGWRGPQAPGHGLVLWDLVYPDEPELFRIGPDLRRSNRSSR